MYIIKVIIKPQVIIIISPKREKSEFEESIAGNQT